MYVSKSHHKQIAEEKIEPYSWKQKLLISKWKSYFENHNWISGKKELNSLKMIMNSKVGTDLHLGEACLSRELELDEALIEDEDGSRQTARGITGGL